MNYESTEKKRVGLLVTFRTRLPSGVEHLGFDLTKINHVREI